MRVFWYNIVRHFGLRHKCKKSNERTEFMYDLQKPNMWKRIAAALLDFFVLILLGSAVMLLLLSIFNVEGHTESFRTICDEYEAQSGIDLEEHEMTEEEYNSMAAEKKEAYNKAVSDANYHLMMIMTLTVLSLTFGLLVAYLLSEFTVPLIFKNGQTFGKKAFGIAVMREDGVRVSAVQMFARSILGKFTIETMAPLLIFFSVFLGALDGIVAIIFFLGIAILEIVLLIINKTRTPIHDLLAHTVTVDLQSQMIFNSPEELLEYQQARHAEMVERSE